MSLRTRPLWALLGLVLGATVSAAPGDRPDPASPDRVAIAARLVTDGFWERAADVLAEVQQPPKGQEARFFTLQGMVALNLSRHEDAVGAFTSALEADAEPLVHVYLAQARVALGESSGQPEHYRSALSALDAAAEAGASLAGAWQLRSRAHRALGQDDPAYHALLQGRTRFPDHPGLLEDQLALLIELGLTREALDLGIEALPRLEASEDAWVALGDRLRRAGALHEARAWLEQARVRFDGSVRPRIALAGACLEAELPLCCGQVLAEAAAFDNAYASEAAECFRRAGDIDRALYLNSTVTDDEVKVRQRLGLLLEQGDFAPAAALDARLARLGLLDDEQVAYALAYAHAQDGSRARAEQLLRTLTDPALFQAATALREAMHQGETP